MDNFREEVAVKRNRAFNNIAYFLSWVFLILVGFIGLINLSALMAGQFTIPTIVYTLVSAGLCFLIWRNKDEFRTEYEYTFTNGSLDFAKVFRQAKRKELGSMNVKNISACGHVAGSGFRRYLSMKDIEKKNWFCNRDGNLFYFYYVKENKKHMIVIEPSEEMVDMIRRYLPAGVYQD